MRCDRETSELAIRTMLEVEKHLRETQEKVEKIHPFETEREIAHLEGQKHAATIMKSIVFGQLKKFLPPYSTIHELEGFLTYV